MEAEEWLDEPTEEEEEVSFVVPPKPRQYLSYRFSGLIVEEVTVENYEEVLKPSLAEQVSMFIPPSGFSLADQIRITFSDMKPATICEKFPDIDLVTKRRYRCVAEYLIRQGELAKVKDESGKLVKKIGNMGKAVVIYEPLAKIRQTLQRSGLTEFIKNDQPTQGTALETEPVESN